MRTSLQRHDFSPIPGNSPTRTRPFRSPAPRTLAGLFAALILGAHGASAIEPATPAPMPGPSGSNDVIILAGDHSMVMNVALETAVTGNTVAFFDAATVGMEEAKPLP